MRMIEFLMGPMDGAVVEDTEEYKKYFYCPIEGELYHHYEMNEEGTYEYRGEVSVVS